MNARLLPWTTAVLMLLPASSGACRAGDIALSTFDTDLDGWTKAAGERWLLSYSASGGNPGGFAKGNDQPEYGTTGFFIAPAKFLGDWSSLDGAGFLLWDHDIIDLGADPTRPSPLSVVVLSGPGGSAESLADVSGLTVGSWHSFQVPITESAWNVTAGNWTGLLANVSELRIRGEFVSNGALPGDVFGIDNVRLSAVPEPSALCLIGLGLGALMMLRIGSREAKLMSVLFPLSKPR